MTASSIKTQHTFVQLFLVGGQIILREQASLLYLQLAVHRRGSYTLNIGQKGVYVKCFSSVKITERDVFQGTEGSRTSVSSLQEVFVLGR